MIQLGNSPGEKDQKSQTSERESCSPTTVCCLEVVVAGGESSLIHGLRWVVPSPKSRLGGLSNPKQGHAGMM